MSGHVRDGRRYLPTLVATGVLHLTDWVRDDLPDLLWPALVLDLRGAEAADDFVRFQRAVQEDLRGLVPPQALADGLDGRLTSLDRLVRLEPSAKKAIRLRAAAFDLLATPVVNVIETFFDHPAAWLFEGDLRPSTEGDINLLGQAIVGVLGDSHREAVIKCLSIWSAVQAGTFSSSPETIKLLKVFPGDAATRSRAGSVIRSCWSAAKGAKLHEEPSCYDDSIKWAKMFWGTNSISTRCIRQRDLPSPSPEQELTEADPPGSDGDPVAGGEHLQQLAMDLLSSYIESLERAPSRLYDPGPQQVHSGLVTRVGREVIAVLGCPDLWSMEHGSHIIRILLEVRIQLQWMSIQDPSIYRQYQEFGSGKAKLYTKILEEVPDDVKVPAFSEALDELERLSHNEGVIDFRVVDTSDSFAGKSIRSMAEECGLLDLYRHSYYISSGVAHSEWWSVELHAMELCFNVLHRGHLIPSMSLSVGREVELAFSWVDQLYALIRLSLQVLETDPDTVDQALSWLTTADDPPCDAS